MKNQLKTDEKITEIELVYHNPRNITEQPSVNSSERAHEILRSTWDENKLDLQEQMRVLLLNTKNKCLGVSTVSTGGVNNMLVDLKIVFALALKAKASAMIVAHNHPSGGMTFSREDMALTQKMVDVAEMLELPILDHLLVTSDGYVSMSDKDMMPIARNRHSSLMESNDKYASPSEKQNTKPAFYIFNQNAMGEKPVGAVFLHGKGDGFNIVFDDKRRFVAFPPKIKPETPIQEPASPKKPKTNRQPKHD